MHVTNDGFLQVILMIVSYKHCNLTLQSLFLFCE